MKDRAKQIAAYTSWANTADRTARTAKARQGFLDRFERLVDPDGVLTPAERAKRATKARRAHFKAMALKSVAARQARAQD